MNERESREVGQAFMTAISFRYKAGALGWKKMQEGP